MTSKLKKEFFEVFGVEKQMAAIVSCTPEFLKCEHCEYYKHIEEYKGRCTKLDYPEITAEKLLEMMCILNKHYAENYQCATMLVGDTIEKIKECILKDCIEQSQHIKTKIQQLFKN